MTLKSTTMIAGALLASVTVSACATTISAASQEQLATAARADGMSAAAISKARPVSPNDLHSLYANRTWVWDSGAGYFSGKDRRFAAWSRTDGIGAYAEGQWVLTAGGQVCMNATWHDRGGSAADKTCFDHRQVGNAIYQRKAPAGNWYLFKGPTRKNPGEYGKFKRGDLVSQPLQQIRREEAAGRRANP